MEQNLKPIIIIGYTTTISDDKVKKRTMEELKNPVFWK